MQIAVPSRLDVALHQQLRQRLHLLVGRNGRFGTLGSVPIHYLDTSVNFELVALYATSSAMVIPLRDGDLVSFEWTVASSTGRRALHPPGQGGPRKASSCSPSRAPPTTRRRRPARQPVRHRRARRGGMGISMPVTAARRAPLGLRAA